MPSAPYVAAALRLVEPDRGDLGVGVGDPRDAVLVDRLRVEPGDVLGDEDALLEAAVRELEAGHDVADGVHAVEVGAAALVGEHEAAVHRDALLVVPEAVGRPARGRRPRAAARPRSRRPPSTVTATPVVGGLDALERACRCGTLILRLRNARSSAFDDASSSAATSRGSASTMVTSAPKLRHTLANSQPITPPPSTTTEAGTRSSVQRVLGGDHPLAVDLEAGQACGRRSRRRARRACRCTPCRRR